jgi:enoyl-CoA hydratase/carnithine racemase
MGFEDRSSLVGALAGAGGLGLVVEDARAPGPAPGPGLLRVGVDRAGALPAAGLEPFDLLVSAAPHAGRPWIAAAPGALDDVLATIEARFHSHPVAATIMAQVLRLGARLDFETALLAESFAYSALLAGGAFRAWREAVPRRDRSDAAPRIRYERLPEALHLTLTRASARNAVDAAMRDALCEALEAAALDPDGRDVVISGEGPDFCAGGDLDEFGTAQDPSTAHFIRTLRAPVRLIHRMRDRVTVHAHGAVVGAGLEMAAAAGRVVAAPDARFWLPEIAMGLIPGAGGCVSLPRRIGRRRTLYLALSGVRLSAEDALAWGLVDAIEARP